MNIKGNRKRNTLLKSIKKNYWLYLFVLPAILWYVIFCYVPMGGIVIAFKKFSIVRGVWDSPWVGLKWFKNFFNSYYFPIIIKNTLVISFYSLLTFPIPVIFALILNEVPREKVKKTIQTIMYAPHFISTVVLVGMLNLFFSTDTGFINNILVSLGGTEYSFLTSSSAFKHLYVWSGVWQGLGWSSIIYVAALAAVDPSLHESAMIDGASRIQRIIHINIPTILPTIVITLILRVGQIMTVGGDKALLMKNDRNTDGALVISTYVYERGLVFGEYDYSTAVGLFVNVVNLLMLLTVNAVSKKVSETSLF